MKIALQLVGSTVFSILFFGVLLFWPAGTFDYWQAWVFIAVFAVAAMVPTVYLALDVPGCVSAAPEVRAVRRDQNGAKADQVGIMLTVVAAGVVSALDHRFGWSTVPTAVVVIGNVLGRWSGSAIELVVIQNNYAAATITVEEEQPVVSTGLYGVVRTRCTSGH